MLLEEILKQEQERFIKENLLSDEMLELLKENIMPFNTLMLITDAPLWRLRLSSRCLMRSSHYSMTEILLRVLIAELSLWMAYLRKAKKEKYSYNNGRH